MTDLCCSGIPGCDCCAEPITLTAEEYAEAVDSTLLALGYTRDELADMAARRDFESPVAFMAWHMVRGFKGAS